MTREDKRVLERKREYRRRQKRIGEDSLATVNLIQVAEVFYGGVGCKE